MRYMIRGYLKLVVLKALSKRDMSGYDLIEYTYKQTEVIRPSPGAIYPLLNRMMKEGLLSVKKIGRRKVYSLTTKGKKFHRELVKNKKKLYINFIAKLRFTYDHNKLLGLLDSMNKNSHLITAILPEGLALRKNIINFIIRSDLTKEDVTSLKSVLKEANKKLSTLTKSKKRNKPKLK